jgi:hypothetical protein
LAEYSEICHRTTLDRNCTLLQKVYSNGFQCLIVGHAHMWKYSKEVLFFFPDGVTIVHSLNLQLRLN